MNHKKNHEWIIKRTLKYIEYIVVACSKVFNHGFQTKLRTYKYIQTCNRQPFRLFDTTVDICATKLFAIASRQFLKNPFAIARYFLKFGIRQSIVFARSFFLKNGKITVLFLPPNVKNANEYYRKILYQNLVQENWHYYWLGLLLLAQY